FAIYSFPYLTPHPAIYTLSLHDALPILVHRSYLRQAGGYFFQERATEPADSDCHRRRARSRARAPRSHLSRRKMFAYGRGLVRRSEEHTSELQSRENLVCRLLLEKKNQQ